MHDMVMRIHISVCISVHIISVNIAIPRFLPPSPNSLFVCRERERRGGEQSHVAGRQFRQTRS